LTQSKLAKNLLLNVVPISTIFAGDFNTGFPNEIVKIAETFAPQFTWITKDLGPTLDSRYSENLAHLPNRIAAFLSIFNIGILLRTDHVFVDKQTVENHTINCSLLPDRVSDHSPMEIIINSIG
jgi:endonuclease/exonuclease/phosphatase family metal-dependent hydrolase